MNNNNKFRIDIRIVHKITQLEISLYQSSAIDESFNYIV